MKRSPQKTLSQKSLLSLRKKLRAQKKKIVFTNGTFDILHAGHVTYLEKAKSYGDILIVGVNSDASVRSYKGPNRPIHSQKDRLKVLTALSCVDYAVLFSEPTPLKLIEILQPQVLVKGADWKKSQITGAREVESWGGKVKLVKFLKGRSSTNAIKKLGLEK